MSGALTTIVLASPESSANHSLILWMICGIISLFFLTFVLLTRRSWKLPAGSTPPQIATDRAERSCDAVLSVCALLIPATLGLLTWLHEKIGAGSYMIPLAFALVYFFALLIFTAHLRFNFLWRYNSTFEVSSQKNLRFGYWLTTATSSIVLGLLLMSIPVLQLGFGWLKVKELPVRESPVKIECKTGFSEPAPVRPCNPASIPPPRPHGPRTSN